MMFDGPRHDYAIVIKSHSSLDVHHLQLDVNDGVIILEKDESGWWGGHKENKMNTAWFPYSCVKLLSDMVDLSATVLQNMDVVVTKPYHLELANLPIDVDDIEFVVRQCASGWCEGCTPVNQLVWLPRTCLAPRDQRVLTVQVLMPATDGSMQLSCRSLARDVDATLISKLRDTLKHFRTDVAKHLEVPTNQLQPLMPDAKLPRDSDDTTAMLELLQEWLPPRVESSSMSYCRNCTDTLEKSKVKEMIQAWEQRVGGFAGVV